MTVRVSSSVEINAPPEAVWAVLCDARMPLTAPCEFQWGRLSPPTPVRCELPDSQGGVGARRRCITDRGVVEQEIVEWSVGRRLAFDLVSENTGLSRHVRRMRDVFHLQPTAASAGTTLLTRETDLDATGPCPRLRGLALALAVRRVHRFTLRGFKSIAEAT
jgi:hypothetical protein